MEVRTQTFQEKGVQKKERNPIQCRKIYWCTEITPHQSGTQEVSLIPLPPSLTRVGTEKWREVEQKTSSSLPISTSPLQYRLNLIKATGFHSLMPTVIKNMSRMIYFFFHIAWNLNRNLVFVTQKHLRQTLWHYSLPAPHASEASLSQHTPIWKFWSTQACTRCGNWFSGWPMSSFTLYRASVEAFLWLPHAVTSCLIVHSRWPHL